MASRSMRRRSPMRRRRRRRYIWLGAQFHVPVLAIPSVAAGEGGDHLTIPLVDNTDLGLGVDLLLHRVLFGFSIVSTSSLLDCIIQMQLGVVQTDNSLSPVTQPPDYDDVDVWVKRIPMWTGSFFLRRSAGIGNCGGSSAGTTNATNGLLNNGNPYDIRVKRKINGDQNLVMTFAQVDALAHDDIVPPSSIDLFWFRALVSGGPK